MPAKEIAKLPSRFSETQSEDPDRFARGSANPTENTDVPVKPSRRIR